MKIKRPLTAVSRNGWFYFLSRKLLKRKFTYLYNKAENCRHCAKPRNVMHNAFKNLNLTQLNNKKFINIELMTKKLKQIGNIFLLLIIISCSKSENQNVNQQNNCLPANLQIGVIAFYPFSNGSIDDYSGNTFNLSNTTTANPGIDRAGNPNCAFNFHGTDFLEYVNPTFLNDLPSTNLSISFWYKSSEQDSATLISRDDVQNCPNTSGQWSVKFTNAIISFGVNGGLISTAMSFNWEHIVITSNANEFQLYKNGVLFQSSSDFSYCSFMNPANPTVNQGNLFIGKSYDGLIDDIIIYNRIITPTEVSDLYNLAACCQ